MEERGAYSLFIDDLPKEMTWDWLLQIFRGEGKVIDVFVSHKRRRKNDCRFGFVRFRKLEEAKNAIRNLDGIKVRGKSMKVSFAKYDKKDLYWKDPTQEGEDTFSETMGKEDRSLAAVVNRRSFKDVLNGDPHQMKRTEWVSNNSGNRTEPEAFKNMGKFDKMLIKGMLWRLVEEVFSPNNMKVVKQRLDGVIDEVIYGLQQEEETVEVSYGCSKEDGLQQKKGKEEMSVAFWEIELITSMQHKDQGEDASCVGDLDTSLVLEASIQPFNVVGSEPKSTKEANSCLNPAQVSSECSDVGSGDPTCSGPEVPPGFEAFWARGGPSNQYQEHEKTVGDFGLSKNLEMETNSPQNLGESQRSSSFEIIPQTQLLEPLATGQYEDDEGVLPAEDDLVETQITWDVGKLLGLHVNNEKAMLAALAKVDDCQDFVLPRRRGRPRKKKEIAKK